MGIVLVFDEGKAARLRQMGFRCEESVECGRRAWKFLGTSELMEAAGGVLGARDWAVRNAARF